MKEIVLKGRKVNFFLQYKNVKNLNLRIKADGNIYVSVNKYVSEAEVENFLVSKSDFILSALDKFAIKGNLERKEYIDGEIIKVLGCNRILLVKQGKNNVQINETNLILTVKDVSDFNLKKRIIEKWRKEECEKIITLLCKDIYPMFKKFGISFPEIKYRKMVSRWGSCQPKNNVLTFNTKLVEKPLQCIEYVVFHEFTHFLVPNHSKEFYKRLSEFLPDHKIRKELLNTN